MVNKEPLRASEPRSDSQTHAPSLLWQDKQGARKKGGKAGSRKTNQCSRKRKPWPQERCQHWGGGGMEEASVAGVEREGGEGADETRTLDRSQRIAQWSLEQNGNFGLFSG